MTILQSSRGAGSDTVPLEVLAYNEILGLGHDTEATIVSITAAAPTRIKLVTVSGTDYAKFMIVHNTNVISTKRSGPDRNLEFFLNLKLEVGDILDVKVRHLNDGEVSNFEANIIGF